jgi:hypothetical protein
MTRVPTPYDDPGFARRVVRAFAPFGLRQYVMRWRRARRALRNPDAAVQRRGLPDDSTGPSEVAVYFGDEPTRFYQLEQWLPVLEQLHERRPVVIVTRDPDAFVVAVASTQLPVICVPRFNQMMDFYATAKLSVTLYVNNSRLNFQSLADRSAMHVHVSHGESDKISMASNQVKAYDRVFVAGDAAVWRFRSSVLGIDLDRLIAVGRPQLDLAVAPALPKTDRRTILYAPTWEGEDESNNYTSLDKFGTQIVAAALALPDVRLVYRPHPRVWSSANRGVRAAHRRIRGLIDDARQRDPQAGHLIDRGLPLLGVFDGVDLMVVDVSSVALDFLYRRTDAPLLLTDRRSDPVALRRTTMLSACVNVVSDATVDTIGDLLATELAGDVRVEDRHHARDLYFGGYHVGESTQRFRAAIEEVLADRTRLIAERDSAARLQLTEGVTR